VMRWNCGILILATYFSHTIWITLKN
jgi:hypothetical protein